MHCFEIHFDNSCNYLKFLDLCDTNYAESELFRTNLPATASLVLLSAATRARGIPADFHFGSNDGS